MSIDPTSRAFIELITAYSVGVVNTRRVSFTASTESECIGTATAIRENNRSFLLTAKHNVDDASPSDLRYMPKATAAAVVRESQAPIDRFYVQFRQEFPVVEILCCPWEDLAVLVLDNNFDEQDGSAKYMQFFPWRDDIRSPVVGDILNALGHPVSRTYIVADRREGNHVDREMGVVKHVMSCRVVPNEGGRYIKNYDPESHFLVDYTDVSDAYEPHGFSGCAWWYYRDRDAPIWTADPIFAGVEFSYAKASKLLVSVRPEIVSRWFAEIGL
jgi:hypothetical protein